MLYRSLLMTRTALYARCVIVVPSATTCGQNYAGSAVAESAPQAITWSVCVIRTTVDLDFNWSRASRGSLGDSWASCQFPTWRSPILCSFDRGNLVYKQQTWMLTTGLLNRNIGSWQTSEKVSWDRALKFAKMATRGLAVTQGHWQCHHYKATYDF